jgi:hypothetical protein
VESYEGLGGHECLEKLHRSIPYKNLSQLFLASISDESMNFTSLEDYLP